MVRVDHLESPCVCWCTPDRRATERTPQFIGIRVSIFSSGFGKFRLSRCFSMHKSSRSFRVAFFQNRKCSRIDGRKWLFCITLDRRLARRTWIRFESSQAEPLTSCRSNAIPERVAVGVPVALIEAGTSELPCIRSARRTTRGSHSIIRSSVCAGPVGPRRLCSQFSSV